MFEMTKELSGLVRDILTLFKGYIVADEEQVDEISLRRLVDATGTSLARNTSAHQSDQAVALQYTRNHYADDPDLDKEIRDIKDKTKVSNLKMRLGIAQRQHKQKLLSANDNDKVDLKRRLPRIKNISQTMRDDADDFVKNHKQHIKVHPVTGLKLSPEAIADYEKMLRRSRGYSSNLDGSAIKQAPKLVRHSS